MKKTLYTLALLTCYFPHSYAKLVVGDPNAAADTSFSFKVGFAAFDDKSENSAARWWIAAKDSTIGGMPDSTKKYGLSFINQFPSYFDSKYSIAATPMTNSEDATIYSLAGSAVASTSAANPLWGAEFTHFDVSMQKPIFTVTSAPNILYAVENIEHYDQPTTEKPNITKLLSHDVGAGKTVHSVRGYVNRIYSAYATGAFGSTPDGSIRLHERAVGAPVGGGSGLPYLQTLATVDVVNTTPALIGGVGQTLPAALASFGPSVTIDPVFARVYAGIQATSAALGFAVGISEVLLTATEQPDKTIVYTLSLEQFAPTSVLTSAFNTVLSAYNGSTVRITSATGMQTSTNLPYMIVARDSGTGPQTIYALPLTSTGMVADFSSVQTLFGSNQPIFLGRYFDRVISDGNQIKISGGSFDAQIKVGGSSTLPIATGDLAKMYVVGDSVYAVIAGLNTASTLPGTYQSQAIFAPEGHIVGWSPWSRVLGSDKQMNYSYVAPNALTGFYVAADTQSGTPNFKSVYQTTFDKTSNLTTFLNHATSDGGIQGLFNFNRSTDGFNNEISLMIATAFGKVTIAQTGHTDAGIFKIKTITDNEVITFSGSEINNHTALIAAEIAHSGLDHWIFAAGASGLSVLSDDSTGVSWTGTLSSILSPCLCLPWRKIGDFTFVKKLVADSGYLYVLTNTYLYRILLSSSKFVATSPAALDVQVVLTATELDSNCRLLDVIIDGGYCLLGTTCGMYVLNGGIQKVNFNDGLPAVSKIIAVSTNAEPQRSFKTLSNLYVLSNTFGSQQARIHRFAVQNSVITPLPDTFIASPGSTTVGVPSAFIRFDNYVSNYFTDGSWNVAHSYFTGMSQPAGSNNTPFMQQIIAGVRSGQSSSQIIMKALATYAPLDFIKNNVNVLGLVRESTSGAVIASGSFEAHTNA